MSRPTPTLLAVFAATCLLAFAGCASSDSAAAPPVAEPAPVTLTVFAAASLKGTFTELGRQFESAHAGTSVRFNFTGSSDLVAQLQQGAPADVFASADEKNMAKLTADGLTAAEPVLFASNTLMIAVPPNNPGAVTGMADLARTDLTVVVCAPEVPCGSAAAAVEKAAGIDIRPASEEASVADVLNRVMAGEADAGLVYVTDVASAGGTVVGIDIPEADTSVNRYPIAPLAASPQGSLAQDFIDLVTGPQGQEVLGDAGFGAP